MSVAFSYRCKVSVLAADVVVLGCSAWIMADVHLTLIGPLFGAFFIIYAVIVGCGTYYGFINYIRANVMLFLIFTCFHFVSGGLVIGIDTAHGIGHLALGIFGALMTVVNALWLFVTFTPDPFDMKKAPPINA